MHVFVGRCTCPEIIEWFMEDQAYWLSYDLAPPKPPSSPSPISKSSLFLSFSLCLQEREGRWWVRSQIIRQRESLVPSIIIQYSLYGLSVSIRFDTCFTRGSKLRGPPYFCCRRYLCSLHTLFPFWARQYQLTGEQGGGPEKDDSKTTSGSLRMYSLYAYFYGESLLPFAVLKVFCLLFSIHHQDTLSA